MDRLLEKVQSGDFDPVKEFAGNDDRFLEVKTAMESISNNLPKDVCIRFILTKIVPTVFDKSVDSRIRDGAIEIGLHFLKFANVSILTTSEQEDIFHAIETTYVKVIGELRDSNYPNWDRLWIFLINLCCQKLHSKMSLSNKLLRVVEVAFRNSTSIEQRLKAYDCWTRLIDNTSLNMDHMCTAKQIKLLVTPMKAKFSRTPVVILKRCDTFVYLLEKLQDKATLCLKEFLEFCFGPFDEKNDAEKMKQGRSVPEVCSKSTRLLLEILGHSHKEGLESCLVNEDFNLYKPLITDVNFPNFAEILINSVVQCCYVLNEWSQDLQINDTIIKCLWRSVLQFVQKSNTEVKIRCCAQINNCLRRFLERSRSNKHFYTVLGHIVDLLIKSGIVEKLKEVTFDVSIDLLHHYDNNSSSLNLDNARNFLVSCFEPENGSKFDKIAAGSFKCNVKCENPTLCEVWLKCKINLVPENVPVFIWPVRHFQHFQDFEMVKSKWTKLYASECKSESFKIVIIQEVEKLFLENPLLSSNIVTFLEVISSGETNPTKDFVSKFMRLIELVLTLPNLSNDVVKKITSIVLTYCNQTQHFYKSDNNDEALDKLCSGLEHLVTIHKCYTILPELFNHLKSSQPKILSKFAKRLTTFLEALMLNEDNTVANNTRKVIELLESKENEPESVSLTSSRSQRLVSMASKKSNNSRFVSPLSLKTSVSSPRGKARIDNKRKKEPVVLLTQDNSADYVKIDTEVKINAENLNEHQKEMFKKRREDIPALYQDLTQSQSQDFFDKIAKKTASDEENEKKRKRTDDEDEQQKSKALKATLESGKDVEERKEKDLKEDKKEKDLEENKEDKDLEENKEKDIINMDTQTQIEESMYQDLTGFFGDTVEPVQREPPEELFEEMPPKMFHNKIAENACKVTGTLLEEKKDGVLTKPEMPTINDDSEDGKKHIENNGTEKNEEENVTGTKISPRTARRRARLSESTPLRKSSRNLARRLSSTTSQQSKSVTAAEINKKGTEESTVEKNDEEAQPESTTRKGKKPVKKLQKPEESQEIVQLSKDESERIDTKAKEHIQYDSVCVNRKKQTKKETGRRAVNGKAENISMEELLATVDKRIEESKKVETDDQDNEIPTEFNRQDGNQNEIIAPPDKETEAAKNRTIKKPKRRALPTPVDVSSTDGDVAEERILTWSNEDLPLDVYEFVGEEPSVKTEDVKKTPKKKKKSMSFNRCDYVSKRRRKVKRESREEAFPFHVTADSPLPLSKSPSLRAVSQSSETITLLITRSPPDAKNPESQQMDKISSTLSSPKKRSRAKGSPQTEDVIESSQSTPQMDTSKRRNRRSLKQQTLEEVFKPLVQSPESNRRTTRNSHHYTSSDAAKTDEEIVRPSRLSARRLSLNEPESEKVQVGRRAQRSRSLDLATLTNAPEQTEVVRHRNDTSADTLTCDTFTTNEEHPNASDPQQNCEEAETDILPLSSSESRIEDDVSTSPITCDTPDRIKEFLNNTSDISPINTTSSSPINTTSSEAVDAPTPKTSAANNEVSNVRVARLLQMVNSNVQVSSEGRRWFGNKHRTSSTSRVRKMRMKKEENLDVLTFSREIPSPLTVPASSILKRKFCLDEAATPSPKRKRVNFSDPAITAKKIFLKDSEEYADVDEKPDSTNESQMLNPTEDLIKDLVEKKTQELSPPFDREDALFHFRNFCDSNLKDVNDSEVKAALKLLLENLKVREVLDVICEFFTEATDEIKTVLTEQGSSRRIIDDLIVPAVKDLISVEEFLPTLIELVKKLPDDKLERFISEVSAIKTEEESNTTAETVLPTEDNVENHIVGLNPEKMNDLIKRYVANLKSEERDDFLVNLMGLASNELPVNKQFVNCHVNILQNFVAKMDD